MDSTRFETYLRRENMAHNTVVAYSFVARDYLARHKSVCKSGLLAYRAALIDAYKAKTVNLRVAALNKFLEFVGRGELRLKGVKVQQASYLENVISNADYEFFKERLRSEADKKWYFVVRFLAATGARVGELVCFKAEHVALGHIDICSKGGKARRIYIPAGLRAEAAEWLAGAGRPHGFLFTNWRGLRLTTRGVAQQLKVQARRHGLDERVVYPHSFRHLFAKNFLAASGDLPLLADLMGHEKLDTTRVYLRKSSAEQRGVVDASVTW